MRLSLIQSSRTACLNKIKKLQKEALCSIVGAKGFKRERACNA
jgi:hypothetical protein